MEKLFSCILVLIVLLASYELVVFFTDYSAEQWLVMDYVHGRRELSGFAEAEAEHLSDVRQVMAWARWVLVLGVAVVVLGGVGAYSVRHQTLFLAGVLGILVMLILVLVQLFSFDYLFYWFHRLLFEQGSWVFSSDSRIIQLFPIEFFIRAAQRIFVCALGMYLVLMGVGWLRTKGR